MGARGGPLRLRGSQTGYTGTFAGQEWPGWARKDPEKRACVRLSSGDPVAAALVPVIHAGDAESLRRLLDGHDGPPAARIDDGKGT